MLVNGSDPDVWTIVRKLAGELTGALVTDGKSGTPDEEETAGAEIEGITGAEDADAITPVVLALSERPDEGGAGEEPTSDGLAPLVGEEIAGKEPGVNIKARRETDGGGNTKIRYETKAWKIQARWEANAYEDNPRLGSDGEKVGRSMLDRLTSVWMDRDRSEGRAIVGKPGKVGGNDEVSAESPLGRRLGDVGIAREDNEGTAREDTSRLGMGLREGGGSSVGNSQLDALWAVNFGSEARTVGGILMLSEGTLTGGIVIDIEDKETAGRLRETDGMERDGRLKDAVGRSVKRLEGKSVLRGKSDELNEGSAEVEKEISGKLIEFSAIVGGEFAGVLAEGNASVEIDTSDRLSDGAPAGNGKEIPEDRLKDDGTAIVGIETSGTLNEDGVAGNPKDPLEAGLDDGKFALCKVKEEKSV
ncbi:hypothetical protein GTA08_BOTSDO01080 [Botryosphaeria dothidea]|uniref:Uncharacterized protein n=1 Tax=Botryosphaeria dothidea TaxID=55169 RepID=A0A8H4J6Z5_9PEZI|nr:hypothetical protein GTA08_BOTSDO01080 [Botryosphaeria dothidea]